MGEDSMSGKNNNIETKPGAAVMFTGKWPNKLLWNLNSLYCEKGG